MDIQSLKPFGLKIRIYPKASKTFGHHPNPKKSSDFLFYFRNFSYDFSIDHSSQTALLIEPFFSLQSGGDFL